MKNTKTKISVISSLCVIALFAIFFGSVSFASAQTVYVIDANGNLVDASSAQAQQYLGALNGTNVNVPGVNGNTNGNVGNTSNRNTSPSAQTGFVPYPYLQYQYFPSAVSYYNGTNQPTSYSNQNTSQYGNQFGTQYGSQIGAQGFGQNFGQNGQNQVAPTTSYVSYPTLRYVYHNPAQNAASQTKLYGSAGVNTSRTITATQSVVTAQNQPMTFGGGSGFVMVSEN